MSQYLLPDYTKKMLGESSVELILPGFMNPEVGTTMHNNYVPAVAQAVGMHVFTCVKWVVK